MFNLIQSLVITFIKVLASLAVFRKGPILVGILVGASIMVFANNAKAATVQGTHQEVVQAEKNVSKGIYINDANVRVSKPTTAICNMYRNTLPHYQSIHGANKGARVWLTIVVRRGC